MNLIQSNEYAAFRLILIKFMIFQICCTKYLVKYVVLNSIVSLQLVNIID